jgi:hypothetical protein
LEYCSGARWRIGNGRSGCDAISTGTPPRAEAAAPRAGCPQLSHATIPATPHLRVKSAGESRQPDGTVMGRAVAERVVDHRKRAQECVAMAMHAKDESDKALWLTLAQSWMRLAEHVAHAEEANAADERGDRQTRSPDLAEDEEGAGSPSLDPIAPYWP